MAAMADSRSGDVRVTLGLGTEQLTADLVRTIDSIRAQSMVEWELFVFDGSEGSCVAEHVRAYGDERIQIERIEAGRGCVAHLAEVLHRGRAPFVGLLDAGDEVRPDHLRRLCTLLEAYPRAVVAHAAYELTTASGERRAVVLDGAARAVEEPGRAFRRRAVLDAPRVWLTASLLRRRALASLAVEQRGAADGSPSDVAFFLRAACRGSIAYDPVPTALLGSRGRCSEHEFLTVDDGTGAPTLSTVRRHRAAARELRRWERLSPLELLTLRAAEVRAVHGMLEAVLRRRWSEEPTVAERAALARQAIAADPTLALDVPAWLRLARPAVQGLRRRADERRVIDLRQAGTGTPAPSTPSAAALLAGRANPPARPPATAWVHADREAIAAEEAAIALAERVLLVQDA